VVHCFVTGCAIFIADVLALNMANYLDFDGEFDGEIFCLMEFLRY